MLALGTTEAKYGFDELRGYISKTTDPPVCSFTTISKSGISNPCWRIDTAAGSAPGYSSHILVRQGIVVDLEREYARLTQVEVVHPRRIRSDGQAARIADIEQLIAYLCRAALSGNIDTRRRDFDRRRLYGLIVILA